jgi:methionyl-tRNA synthetase
MSGFGDWAGFDSPVGAFLLVIVVLWSLAWKGLALWHAGRRGDAGWFIAILLINTLGLLEIIYLFGFAKLKRDELFSRGGR